MWFYKTSEKFRTVVCFVITKTRKNRPYVVYCTLWEKQCQCRISVMGKPALYVCQYYEYLSITSLHTGILRPLALPRGSSRVEMSDVGERVYKLGRKFLLWRKWLVFHCDDPDESSYLVPTASTWYIGIILRSILSVEWPLMSLSWALIFLRRFDRPDKEPSFNKV